jgi:hypothetical protein
VLLAADVTRSLLVVHSAAIVAHLLANAHLGLAADGHDRRPPRGRVGVAGRARRHLADLQRDARPALPTFDDYLPQVLAAAGPGALRAYCSADGVASATEVLVDVEADRSDCNTCGHHCNDASNRKPCPRCGGLIRKICVYSHDSISLTDELTEIAAGFGPVRPWQEQWRRVEQRWDQVQATDGGTASGGIEAWRDAVLDFRVAVHHLHEHIGNDPNEPRVSLRTAVDWVHNDSDLKIAVAVSNTHKHHTHSRSPSTTVGWSSETLNTLASQRCGMA